ncbi:MAG: hypothetical protein WCQ21_00435 [Verrucomicrobiota bacterium]
MLNLGWLVCDVLLHWCRFWGEMRDVLGDHIIIRHPVRQFALSLFALPTTPTGIVLLLRTAAPASIFIRSTMRLTWPIMIRDMPMFAMSTPLLTRT